MKKINSEQFPKLAAQIQAAKTSMVGSTDRDANITPIFVDDVLVFKASDDSVIFDRRKIDKNNYDFMIANDGKEISLTAVTRRGNGITFSSNSLSDRLDELCAWAVQGFQLTVVSDKVRINSRGTSQHYYTFDLTLDEEQKVAKGQKK